MSNDQGTRDNVLPEKLLPVLNIPGYKQTCKRWGEEQQKDLVLGLLCSGF